MKEQVFNLFVVVTGDYIRKLGAIAHHIAGSDFDKLKYLRERAILDAGAARYFAVPARYRVKLEDGTRIHALDYGVFQQMSNGGRLLEVFDEILDELQSGPSPLVCVTPVVDGTVRIDQVCDLPETPPLLTRATINRFGVPDYVAVYLTPQGFDVGRLLNDDYLRAVKLLFRERLFVSAAKLLMSFIDTVGYLDAGDMQGSFQRWLNKNVLLQPLDVSADELWEFRNSLLHMTNIDSRKVAAAKVGRVSFYVGQMPIGIAPRHSETKFFDLHGLILALCDGLEKWTSVFNHDSAKLNRFIERYDRILSDVRYEEWWHDPIELDD